MGGHGNQVGCWVRTVLGERRLVGNQPEARRQDSQLRGGLRGLVVGRLMWRASGTG
jgi:hypothetical protein